MSKTRLGAFTLIEMLLGLTVFSLLAVLLFEVVSQSSRIGRATNAETDRVDKVGIAFDMMRRDLKSALLPIDASSTNGLQFLLNPDSGIPASVKNPHTAFWQAPVAANIQGGDIAIVGYFIRKDASSTPPRFNLCRLQIDPYNPAQASGSGDYLIESGLPWLSEQILQNQASAQAPEYSGLILEGAIALWIRAIDESGAYSKTWDSRVSKKLPKALEVALVVMDNQTMGKVTSLPDAISTSAADFDAEIDTYLAQLPVDLRKGVRVFRTILPVDNHRYSTP